MKSRIMTKTVMMIAGAALLAGAAMPVHAAREFNIYGASAQYLFWNAVAPAFLTSATGGNCTGGVTQAQFNVTGSSENGKHGVTIGNNCGNFGNEQVIIRYSSKASYDGIYAVAGSLANGCTDPYQRMMANEATISGSNLTGRKCVTVNVGASDVAGASFTQQSHGALLGPNNGAFTDREFSSIDTAGLAYSNPVVVPFGFFANNSIKVQRCVGGTSVGEMCTVGTQGTDCPGSTCQAPAEAQPLDNITREMAVLIFSGQVTNWTDFGAGFPAGLPIVACLRHAGSGTHSTLDNAVVKSGGWGGNLSLYENTKADAATYGGQIAYFNDGSGDEMKCINGTTPDSADQNWGAIGYADADQSLSSYPRTHALKYNGLYGTRVNIRNGMYDFFSNQWMYTTNPTDALYLAMMDYASDPANIPSGKAKYWATYDEMSFKKGSDQAYPVYDVAFDPQTP